VSEKSESTKLARINLAAGSRYEHIDLRSLPTFDGELETLVMNPENTMHIDQLPKNVWCGTCSSTTQIQPLVHHYGGTWEQWSFRQDARRNLENDRTWEAYTKLQLFEDGETGHIRPWLSEFVQRNGQELASALLKGVGEVPPRKATWQ
jgi:hypothetical protein